MTVTRARLILVAAASLVVPDPARAQPAQGAPAAMDRVREVAADATRNLKLTGDPDKDFALMLAAWQENLAFLAKTQLEYGGDRQLRGLAQALSDDAQARIEVIKQWQVRRAGADYRAQPDQPSPGSGPLDHRTVAAAVPAVQAAPAAEPAKDLPLVRGRIEDLDAAQGKVTIEHEAIPNLSMEGMTMVFRAGEPGLLKSLRKGDAVRFSADRVDGQLTVISIRKGR